MQKSLSSKHRALVNIGWASSPDEEDIQTKFDITLNWFGEKRIPSTSSNPQNFRMGETSPSFAVVNAQVTKTIIFNLELYLGVENLFNYKQNNLIIDPGNPYGNYFDASLIWGPVNGRMVYSGLRYKM
jgi:outer membrane receptor protein involved in Fe transport